MAEIAIGNIIKMAIAVAVMALVIGGVALSYSRYIAPYFAVEEEPPKDISTSYYQGLMVPQNVVASAIEESSGYSYVWINGGRTDYYFKGIDLYKDVPFSSSVLKLGWDPKVGAIKNDKIEIDSNYLSDPVLKVLEGAEKVGAAIYKIKR